MNFNSKIKDKIVSHNSKNQEISGWEELQIIEQGEPNNYLHQKCPSCNKKSLLTDKINGDYFCEHCNWQGNVLTSKLLQKFNKDIKKSWWFEIENHEDLYVKMSEKYFIDKETIDNLGIKYQRHYFKKEEKIRGSLVVPAYSLDKEKVINYYFIPLDKEYNILNYTESLNSNIIGLNSLNHEDKENSKDTIFIVNSVIDYITLNQLNEDTDIKYKRLICIPNNIDTININNEKEWEFLKSIENEIFKFDKYLTVFPQDLHNEKIKLELSRRLGLHSCSYIDFNEYKDDIKNIENKESISIFDIFKEGFEEAVREVLDKPTIYPIQGLHQLSEFEEDIDDIFENGLSPGYSWGYEQLDKYMTLKFGQWTLVTGIPGHGKSSFVEACLINLSYLHNFKIAMFSPENTPLSRFYIGMIQKASGKSYKKGSNNKIETEEHNYWKNWINDRFFSILPEDNMTKSEDFSIDKGNSGSMTLSGILSLAAKAVYRHGIKILVIDPWTEVEHQRPNGMTELEYLSKSISLIKMFAKSYDVHVIVVAHPTKILKNADNVYPIPTPYNIAGGAHWRNKGDNIFTVYRNVGFPDEDVSDIYIQKVRFEECGQVGSFSIRADKSTNFYYDDIDQEKRRNLLERRMTPNSKESEAISIEEMLSSSMRLGRNFNLRKLPEKFQVKNSISGNVNVQTDYSYQEAPPF